MILLTSFILGLSGGFGHCIGMCHPFVLYLSSRYPSTGYNILIPQLKYNLGRTITYAFLGFLVGFLGHLEILTGNTANMRSVLTILAGAFLVFMALFTFAGRHIKLPSGYMDKFQKYLSINSSFLTGIILGFLPCGAVMAALATSAVSTGPITGALTMALFGIGTSFALLLLALFGGLILRHIAVMRWVFMAVIFITGCMFIMKGIARL